MKTIATASITRVKKVANSLNEILILAKGTNPQVLY